MPKSMLDQIVRALVGDSTHHGIMLDVINRLNADRNGEFRKRLSAVLREPSPAPSAMDTIIRIDRAAAVPYPDWVKEVLHPAIERSAPAEYDLAELPTPWLHEGQKDGKYVQGRVIYEYLKDNKMLDGCLSLSDGLAIQQKGLDVYRKVFGTKVVFLWGSVVRYRDGNLLVPGLVENDGQVVLRWYWLDLNFDDYDLALRFAD